MQHLKKYTPHVPFLRKLPKNVNKEVNKGRRKHQIQESGIQGRRELKRSPEIIAIQKAQRTTNSNWRRRVYSDPI